jgi:UDP-N-acetylglucosamine 1-carboxyvinyltransferase
MDALKIRGQEPLSGIIDISGSKNATLPIMAATILAPGKSRLGRVPDLADVRTLQRVLAHLGIKIERNGPELNLDASDITEFEAPYELVRTMRASILVLGPLLARFGRARVSLPGGCAIGARPIDQHLKGLKKLGATITLEHGYVEAKADKLVGTEIIFDMPTVGGTEHLMITASLAEGTTVLRNAAREPEIVDLALVLRKMGVNIQGEGTERITIVGQKELKPFDHDVVADRIELGTFLIAGAMMGENLTLRGGIIDHQTALLDKLVQAGTEISIDKKNNQITVSRPKRLEPVNINRYAGANDDTDVRG